MGEVVHMVRTKPCESKNIAELLCKQVWFKLKKPLAGDDLPTIKSKAAELKGIPGVISVEVGSCSVAPPFLLPQTH